MYVYTKLYKNNKLVRSDELIYKDHKDIKVLEELYETTGIKCFWLSLSGIN